MRQVVCCLHMKLLASVTAVFLVQCLEAEAYIAGFGKLVHDYVAAVVREEDKMQCMLLKCDSKEQINSSPAVRVIMTTLPWVTTCMPEQAEATLPWGLYEKPLARRSDLTNASCFSLCASLDA